MKTSWDSKRYDEQHQYVADLGMDLLQLLNPQPGESILDLGCGTGKLTHAITQSGAGVVGIDASLDMIETAKQSYPEILFKVADGQNFFFSTPFDAIFSNAALHWMLEPEKVIQCIRQSLKNKGRFVFEMGGKNNIKTVLSAIQKAATAYELGQLQLENYFPSVAAYASLLEAQGFRVIYMQLFDRPTLLQGEDGLQNWVRMFRASVLQHVSADQQAAFLTRVEEEARAALFHDGSWWADYVRLRGVAIKI